MNNKKHNKRINYSNSLKVAIILLGTMGRCVNASGYPDRPSRSERLQYTLPPRVTQVNNELAKKLEAQRVVAEKNATTNNPAERPIQYVSASGSGYYENTPAPKQAESQIGKETPATQGKEGSTSSGSRSDIGSLPLTNGTLTYSTECDSRSTLSNGDKTGLSTEHYQLNGASDEEVGMSEEDRSEEYRSEYRSDWTNLLLVYTQLPDGKPQVCKKSEQDRRRASSAPAPDKHLRTLINAVIDPLLPKGDRGNIMGPLIKTLSFTPPARR